MVFALSAGAAMAQTPRSSGPRHAEAGRPGADAPAPAAPAAQTPPAPPPAPPKPFPEGAKIAYVNVQAIASNSVEGKAATVQAR